jgi:hypothetical protein
MSPAEVKRKVLDEIGDDFTRSNPHGVDLEKSLLPTPMRKSFQNSFFDPKLQESDVNPRKEEFWLILEEQPVTKNGYEIVYAEARNQFGLAVGGIFIAFYGSFMEALGAL